MNISTLGILFSASLCGIVLSGCQKKEPPAAPAPQAAAAAPAVPAAPAASLPPPNPDNNVYFGAVHVHTGWSFDAFTNGSKTTPSDAYAWAQGKAITGSGGPEIQLKTPLDFYMVSDHAEFMGVFNQMANPDSPLSKTELAKGVTSPDANVRIQTFAGILRDMSAGKRDPQLTDPALARSVWAQIVKANMVKNATFILQEENLPRFKENALARAREFDLTNILPQYEAYYERIVAESREELEREL